MRKLLPAAALLAIAGALASFNIRMPMLAGPLFPGRGIPDGFRHGGAGHTKSDLFLNRTRALGVKWRP
jgi:hypothetical protein